MKGRFERRAVVKEVNPLKQGLKLSRRLFTIICKS